MICNAKIGEQAWRKKCKEKKRINHIHVKMLMIMNEIDWNLTLEIFLIAFQQKCEIGQFFFWWRFNNENNNDNISNN